MRTFGVSSFSQAQVNRAQLQKLQLEYTSNLSELSSGRKADLSLALGATYAKFVSVDSSIRSMDAILSSNAMLSTRLQATDEALRGVDETGSTYRSALIAAKAGSLAQAGLQAQSSQLFESLLGFINSTLGGDYLLSGINSDRPALRGLPGEGQALVASSFQQAFDMSIDDPRVSTISPEEMSAWIDTSFTDLFESPAWEEVWSGAGDVSQVRVGERQFMRNGVSAEDPALRKLVMSFVMTSVVGASNLHEKTFGAIVDKSLALVEDGRAGVTSLRSDIGSRLSRLDQSSQTLSARKDLYSAISGDMAEVDVMELSLRIESIRSRLDASYNLTARLSNLSLANYL